MTTHIPLERIVTLRVPVSWHEAVALAQQVGRAANAAATAVGLDNCLLSTSGAIEVVGTSRTPFVGEPTGAALRALLDPAQAPRELLTLVRRSDAPAFEDISKDLEFFARPDATALSVALANRALSLEAELQQHAELERLRAEATTGAPTTSQPPADNRRLVPWALGGLAVVATATAFALGTAGSDTPAPMSSNATAQAQASPQDAPAQASTVQQITGRLESLVDKGIAALGLSSGRPAAAPAEKAVAAAPEPAPRLARRAPVPSNAAPLVVVMPRASEDTPRASNVEIISETDFLVSDGVVHDASSTDLQPPVLRWPQLPNDPESLPVEAGTSYLEILINEGGTVDKVRLRAVRISYHERMLVSAAKAWVFHPAHKDGRPVKYLMRVPIVAQ